MAVVQKGNMINSTAARRTAAMLPLLLLLGLLTALPVRLAHAVTGGDAFVSLTPARLADSRTGVGGFGSTPLAANETRNLTVSGRAGVPTTGATAVLLDIEIVNAQSNTHVTVYPAGATRPATSSANTVTGVNISNSLVTKLGSNGQISVYNSGGPAHVIFDVQGYFKPGDSTTAGGFVPVEPTRLVDSRDGTGGVYGSLASGSSVNVKLAGVGPVTSDATSLFANFTITGASGSGYVTLYRPGTARPGTSTVNYTTGTSSGSGTAQLDSAGYATLYNSGPATINFVVDAQGFFTSRSDGGGLTSTQARVYDSRLSGGRLQPGEIREFQVGGLNGVPSNLPLGSVIANFQAVAPATSGFLRVWPGGEEEPPTSMANFTSGATRGNVVVTALGEVGRFAVKNESPGTVDLVVDMQGWFSAPSPRFEGDGTTTYFAPGDPEVCETTGETPCVMEVDVETQTGGRVDGEQDGAAAAGVDGGMALRVTSTRPAYRQIKRFSATQGAWKVHMHFPQNWDGAYTWHSAGDQPTCGVNWALGVGVSNTKCDYAGPQYYGGSGTRKRALSSWQFSAICSGCPGFSFTKYIWANMYPSGHYYVHNSRRSPV